MDGLPNSVVAACLEGCGTIAGASLPGGEDRLREWEFNPAIDDQDGAGAPRVQRPVEGEFHKMVATGPADEPGVQRSGSRGGVVGASDRAGDVVAAIIYRSD